MKYFSQFFSLLHILHILMQKCKKNKMKTILNSYQFIWLITFIKFSHRMNSYLS